MTTMPLERPGNRKDCEYFNALTEWEQDIVRKVANRMYDGTRTAARCWKLALGSLS